jgi:hypothetical protein
MKIAPNRVLLAFKSWEDRKKELNPLLATGSTDQRIVNGLQLEHLRQAKHRLPESVRPGEKPFLVLSKNRIGKLEKRLYPSLLRRLFSQLKDRFFDGAVCLKNHLSADEKQVCLPLDCQLGPDKKLNFDLHFAKDNHGHFQLHRPDGALLEQGKIVRSHQFELHNWPGLQTNHAWSLPEGRSLKQNFKDASGHENQRWSSLAQKESSIMIPDMRSMSKPP